MRNWRLDANYGIGTTPNSIIPLRRLGVPVPDQVVGSSASVFYTRADASRVGDGYAAVSWVYDVISLTALYKLLAFLEGEDWVDIYVRTDLREGTVVRPSAGFDVYYGKMLRPILTGQEGNAIARSPYSYQSVKILFNNLQFQPGYAITK